MMPRVKHKITEVDADGASGSCTACGPVPVRRYVDGRNGRTYYDCKIRFNARARAHYQDDGGADKQRAKRKRMWHGLTTDERDALLAKQEGRCAICGEASEKLVVDHDHSCCPRGYSCGACVRALLCSSCNLGIGHFQEDPGRLRAAIAYLGRFS